MFEVDSVMWLSYTMTDAYTMNRLTVDDTPTSVARRDGTNFSSPQDCINFSACVVAYPLSLPIQQSQNTPTL